MFTCKICGLEFGLHIEDHYISRDGERTGLIAAIGPENESKLFDTFDCPECGCQNVIQEKENIRIFMIWNRRNLKKMYESDDRMVSHPDHYQSETGMEVIDVIEAFTFDLKGIEATDTGNVIKYICRWKNKNGLQDLKKAMWYLQHLIEHVDKLEKENQK